MASGFVTYHSINALFATHLQKDLGLSPGLVATPIALVNIAVFVAVGWWGWVSDRFVCALLLSPETKGKVLVADLQIA